MINSVLCGRIGKNTIISSPTVYFPLGIEFQPFNQNATDNKRLLGYLADLLVPFSCLVEVGLV